MPQKDPIDRQTVETFIAKATAVDAVVRELPTMSAALRYVVDVCDGKNPAEILADEPGTEQGPPGPNNQPTRVKRIVAAPDLGGEEFAALSKACEEKGFLCVRQGLRKYVAGFDVGVTQAVLGVAASGTCMMNTDEEDPRLAGMISEIHVVFLRKSVIYPDLPSIAQLLRERMNEAPATYTTLVSGPSRTADIERVAALGVHGPLELHIVLLED
ncbi:MAG: lactate utilization protein [Candidatus Accumulibacter sp.]|jgi:L-lactate dehydrogenase complex protein LldG|nr:lactate utilization protein [Accumulibacter sp.]